VIVGGLEVAILVTRPYGDAARFQVAAASLLASLAAPPMYRPASSAIGSRPAPGEMRRDGEENERRHR